jgi:hypothetical protein
MPPAQEASDRVGHPTRSSVELDQPARLVKRVRACAVFDFEEIGWDDFPPTDLQPVLQPEVGGHPCVG